MSWCLVRLLPEKMRPKPRSTHPCNQRFWWCKQIQQVQAHQGGPCDQRECGSLREKKSLLDSEVRASFVVCPIFQVSPHLCPHQRQQSLHWLVATRRILHTEQVIEAGIQFTKIFRERLLRRIHRRALVLVRVTYAYRGRLKASCTSHDRGVVLAGHNWGSSASGYCTTNRKARSEGQGHGTIFGVKKKN